MYSVNGAVVSYVQLLSMMHSNVSDEAYSEDHVQ